MCVFEFFLRGTIVLLLWYGSVIVNEWYETLIVLEMERGVAVPAHFVFPRFEPVLDSRTKKYIMKGRLFKGTIQTYT